MKNHRRKTQVSKRIKDWNWTNNRFIFRSPSGCFLGAGTTIYASRFAARTKDINYVIPDNLWYLNKDVLTGGFYHRTTNEFVGTIAEQTLNSYLFDLVISTNVVFWNQVTTSKFWWKKYQKLLWSVVRKTIISLLTILSLERRFLCFCRTKDLTRI